MKKTIIALMALAAVFSGGNAAHAKPLIITNATTWLKTTDGPPFSYLMVDCLCGINRLTLFHTKRKNARRRDIAYIFGYQACTSPENPQYFYAKNGQDVTLTMTGCGRFNYGVLEGRVMRKVEKIL